MNNKEIRNKYLVIIKEMEEITFEELGDIFNISRQRAYQIYNKSPIIPYSGDSTPPLSSKEGSKEVNNQARGEVK